MIGEHVQFRYGPRTGYASKLALMIPIIFICSWCAVGLAVVAARPDKNDYENLLYFGKVTAFQARLIWGACSAMSFVIVLLFVRRLLVSCFISLTPDVLIAPKSNLFSLRPVEVPYRNVLEVRFRQKTSGRYLTLVFDRGMVEIVDAWFPSEADFNLFCQLLRERVGCEVPLEPGK